MIELMKDKTGTNDVNLPRNFRVMYIYQIVNKFKQQIQREY